MNICPSKFNGYSFICNIGTTVPFTLLKDAKTCSCDICQESLQFNNASYRCTHEKFHDLCLFCIESKLTEENINTESKGIKMALEGSSQGSYQLTVVQEKNLGDSRKIETSYNETLWNNKQKIEEKGFSGTTSFGHSNADSDDSESTSQK
jgi:hypothetical protein